MIVTDAHELDLLAIDLGDAPAEVVARAVPALERSAQNIEDQAREWAPKKGVQHYADTITHDVTAGAGVLEAEIGPDKTINGQAKLGHILEYGSINNAPFAHLGPAFDREVPDFEDAVAEAGEEAL